MPPGEKSNVNSRGKTRFWKSGDCFTAQAVQPILQHPNRHVLDDFGKENIVLPLNNGTVSLADLLIPQRSDRHSRG
jgi:hypothetical protein